jgi:hypothetical protein
MKAAAKILAAVAAIVVVAGLVVCAIYEARAAAARMKCKHNLKQLGNAIHGYHSVADHYPVGTIQGTDLPPDKRLSWYVEIYPAFMMGGVKLHVDWRKAWDDPDNCPPLESYGKLPEESQGPEIAGRIKLFQCRPVDPDPGQPCPTHYVGVAGLGADAATLPLNDPRAGFFGYDRKLAEADVKDGLSTTLMLLEAQDGGPWTAGGRSTVRGLVNDGTPCVGVQLESGHRGDRLFSRRMQTLALFADGSVRRLDESTSPRVIEAQATVAAGDEAGFDD